MGGRNCKLGLLGVGFAMGHDDSGILDLSEKLSFALGIDAKRVLMIRSVLNIS